MGSILSEIPVIFYIEDDSQENCNILLEKMYIISDNEKKHIKLESKEVFERFTKIIEDSLITKVRIKIGDDKEIIKATRGLTNA